MIILLTILVLALIFIKVHNSLSGNNIILDAIDNLYFRFLSLEKCELKYESNKNQSDIVVCLTTIPSRIDKLEPTLKSLLAQTEAPQEIRIHIPHYSKRESTPYTIPDFMKSLKGVTLVRCDDYGPATKLLPALRDFPPEQKLLIVDDDRLYPRNMIADINRLSQANPDIAIASSGWVVPADLIDRPTSVFTGPFMRPPAPIAGTRLYRPREVDILQGFSGYLVKPRFFRFPEIFDYSLAPEAAFFVDDVWISAHCQVPKKVFPARRFCFTDKRRQRYYKKSSLGFINRGGGDVQKRNNTIMIQFFKDRWLQQQGEPGRST